MLVCISQVDLSWNGLGPDGANALVDGGAFMGSLTHCDVQFNYLGDEGKKVLQRAAKGKANFKLGL